MGRLENFIPRLMPNQISTTPDGSLILFDEQAPIPVHEKVASFIKQMNGHLSLKEIFLFLNTKGDSFSIQKCLGFLHHLAEKQCLQNSDDYFNLKALEPFKKKSTAPRTSFSKDYFSSERLIGLIQKTTLFLECDRHTAENLLSHAQLLNPQEGDRLIEKGTKSSHFYVLLAGEAGVYWKDECLAQLGPLSVFGESAAVFDTVRNADVIANEASWVLQIDASQIVDTSEPKSFDAFKGLKSRLVLNQTLLANPLFQDLPTDTMQLFISKCRIEKWGKEQTVIEQDEASGDFYFILEGSVTVLKDNFPVTSLTEGDHFGEVAAIFNEPRTASIISETPCTFLALNQKALFEVLCSHFRLGVDVEKTAAQRRNSSGNVLSLFEEDFAPANDDPFNQSISDFKLDEDFLEITHTNFELEIIDFSSAEKKSS